MDYSKYESNKNGSSNTPEEYQEVIEQLIPDVLMLVQDVLCNDNYKAVDRLRAAQLVGKWYGLENPDKSNKKNEIDLKDYLKGLAN